MRGVISLGAALALLGLGSSLALAATPVSGFINGPVSSVKAKTFVVTTTQVPKGRAKVSVAASTVISEQLAGKASDLKKGVCAFANGQRNSKGTVTAVRITLSRPVKGVCVNGFGGEGPRPGGGQRPGGGRPPGQNRPPGQLRPPAGGPGRRSGFAGFGFASGAITAVNGSRITLHSRQRGSAVVAFSAKTSIVKNSIVGASAIKAKLCAFVQGTSSDKGVTVAAQSISLTKPASNGCSSGFPGGPGRRPSSQRRTG